MKPQYRLEPKGGKISAGIGAFPKRLVFGEPTSIAAKEKMCKASNGVPAPNRTTSPWRLKSREVIATTLAKFPSHDTATLKKELSAVYPFGMRKYTPYKIWCAEVKAALATVKRADAPESESK